MELPWKPKELHEWAALIAITAVVIMTVISFNKQIKDIGDPNSQTVVEVNIVDQNN